MKNELILVFAFRYALGRMSAAPSIVIRELKVNWSEIKTYTKEQIQEDIRDAIKRNMAGMACDVKSWNEVLEWEITE